MSQTVISVRHLSTRFGSQWVHRELNFQVARGEMVAVVGGSGSGKTTLLRQILGLERPLAGEIRLFDEPLLSGDAHRDARLRQRFGVLFQHGALFSAFTVFDNIAFPLRELKTLDEALIRDLVMMKLAQVELKPETARKMPAELSGGMVKRVALARALALEPELLLLDEPTAGLDPDRATAFVKLIQQLRQDLALTVVLVTHDLDTLKALQPTVAVLAEKKVMAQSELSEVIQIDHPFIRSFFASIIGAGPEVQS